MDGTASPPQPAPPQPDWVPRRRLTVRDYHAMGEAGILRREDRVELIEGELIAMSPVGVPHAAQLLVMSELLAPQLVGRAVVAMQNPIRLGDFSEPEPDIALVRPPGRRYVDALPVPADVFLLIEISDTTLRYDSTVKAALYAKHGIVEYWIIDIAGHAVLVHRAPTAEGYAETRRATAGETLEPLALPGLRLAVADMLA